MRDAFGLRTKRRGRHEHLGYVRAYRETGEARRNLDWGLEQETPDGYFRGCAFEPGSAPFTHTDMTTRAAEAVLQHVRGAVKGAPPNCGRYAPLWYAS